MLPPCRVNDLSRRLENAAQFFGFGRLFEVKINPNFVRPFSVLFSAKSCHSYDLRTAEKPHLTQPANDLPPVHSSRQAEVQQHHVRWSPFCRRQSGRTVANDLDIVTRNDQEQGQALGRIRFVFNDEDLHGALR